MENILSNIDLLYQILENFDLKEHLNLIKVCTQFRTVIIDFIWKNKCKEIEITLNPNIGYIQLNTQPNTKKPYIIKTEEKVLLNKDDYKECIHLISNYINKLVLHSFNRSTACFDSDNAAKDMFSLTDFDLTFDKENKFTNLQSITFKRLRLTMEHLRLVKENCPKLEECILEYCKINRKILLLGYGRLTDMISMKMTKCLETEAFMFDLNELTLDMQIGNGKELKKGVNHNQQICNEFNNRVLNTGNKFNKLTIWTDEIDLISIREKLYSTLSNTCPTLNYLKLKYLKIKDFIPINTLTELELKHCHGMTWNHLKLILHDMKLKSFSTDCTRYKGKFEYFDISKTFENLTIIEPGRKEEKLFKMNVQNLTNLSTFSCYSLDHDWFTSIASTKLHTLTIICSETLFSNYDGNSSLMDLLTWTPLSSLIIKRNYEYDYEEIACAYNELLKIEEIKTNLKYLEIPVQFVIEYYDEEYLSHCMDFWLNVLRQNRNMKLAITGSEGVNINFIYEMLNSSKFPNHLKSINVNGFNIEIPKPKEILEKEIDNAKLFFSTKLNPYILL